MNATEHSPTCLECGSERVGVIVYGYPAPELLERAKPVEGGYEMAGALFTIGGCVLTGDDPDYRCFDCGMGIDEWPPVNPA